MAVPLIKSASMKNLNLYSLCFFTILLASCDNSTSHGAGEKLLPDPLEAGWKGSKVCEVLEDNDDVRVLKCTFPPGVGHERHYHPTHFGYTLKVGTFQIADTTGTREVTIPDGYSFLNEKIAWHEVLNVGQDTAIFLIMEPK